MKTLEEVNEMIENHLCWSKQQDTSRDGLIPKDEYKEVLRQRKAWAKEYKRLLLMRNYLERVSPEMIAATHKRISDLINRLESSWGGHAKTFGALTSTVVKARRKQFEKETKLPKLKKQLKETSWIIN